MELALHLLDTLVLSWIVISLHGEALTTGQTSCLLNSRDVLVSTTVEDEMVLTTQIQKCGAA